MAAMGIPEDQMVVALKNPRTTAPISPVTLRKHYRKELDEGFIQANAKVAGQLYKNATTETDIYPGGVPIAQIFWLKCRARWQQHPERQPPPPAPTSTPLDERETARRVAFILRKETAAKEREANPTAPARKRKITIPAG